LVFSRWQEASFLTVRGKQLLGFGAADTVG